MRDLKDLLEPLSRTEMPDRWNEVRERLPHRLPPEPPRSRFGVYAVAVGALALVVAIVIAIDPLGSDEKPQPGGPSGGPPTWLVDQAYGMAYANGDITPSSSQWILADAATIAPAVGLDHGGLNLQEYLVVLHGDFTAYAAKIPAGSDPPTGHVLAVAFDAQTHEVTDSGLGGQDVTVPGLEPFTLPTPADTYTDDAGGCAEASWRQRLRDESDSQSTCFDRGDRLEPSAACYSFRGVGFRQRNLFQVLQWRTLPNGCRLRSLQDGGPHSRRPHGSDLSEH